MQHQIEKTTKEIDTKWIQDFKIETKKEELNESKEQVLRSISYSHVDLATRLKGGGQLLITEFGDNSPYEYGRLIRITWSGKVNKHFIACCHELKLKLELHPPGLPNYGTAQLTCKIYDKDKEEMVKFLHAIDTIVPLDRPIKQELFDWLKLGKIVDEDGFYAKLRKYVDDDFFELFHIEKKIQ